MTGGSGALGDLISGASGALEARYLADLTLWKFDIWRILTLWILDIRLVWLFGDLITGGSGSLET